MQLFPLVSKARKPKFELHLKIYDLNNVPLVSGVSLIKWHLVHSIHSEHRGRTQKCPIQNHRVEYNYAKVVPVRIAIDKNGNLGECPIEFEVLQEFSVPGPAGVGSRDEKVSLGIVTLNLSEYVEESEAIVRDGLTPASRRISVITPLLSDRASSHHRKRSSMSGLTVGSGELHPSPRSSYPASELDEDQRPASDVQDGVVRRYLMQESKINSTLKLSILMLQTEGERNFVAPPLKTAPVFGGIAGFVANDALNEPVDAAATPPTTAHVPSISHKTRDVAELQDMYRRALAASWASPPGELPADQCIEDIFAGGDGFRAPAPAPTSRQHQHQPSSTSPRPHRDDSASTTSADDDDPTRGSSGGGGSNGMGGTTLRPRDLARLRLRLRGDSSGSNTTVREGGSHRDLTQLLHFHHSHHQRDRERGSKDVAAAAAAERGRDEQQQPVATAAGAATSPLRSRSESMASLAPTLASGDSSERGRRDGFKRAREVDEFEVREDLVAWAVPA
ncbi:N-terminal C2 in EEIG1 and EHBP1 proteins-domain-containing protein [Schizothecium vesticola]|uniref:N-terminal C2 in EEIG1 and EHBP1 proteins-domain-containing protein n=1 Tax=Schizothecium vesticola TaxID=314040 RepID=A0AA40F1C5_9PEZI|nr:N-terminal C2 in EEIG1 and EHBP1 proteins-domain-containing protein [Schizothecium vesticola]